MRTMIAIGSLLSLASCGGRHGAVDFTQVCGDLAAARCAKRSSCSGGAQITRLYGDLPTCLAREALVCTRGSASSGSGNTQDTLEQCAGAVPSMTCADFFNDVVPPPCVSIGSRAAGEPCTFASQCASNFCVSNKTAVCGSCGAPPVANDQCMTSNCYHDQVCVEATLTCQPEAAMGAACDANHPCGTGLSCLSALCVAAVETAGATCAGKSPGCDPVAGLYCNGVSGGTRACAAIVYVADGQPCGNFADGSFASCRTGFCYTDIGIALSGQMGLCKAAAADGAACDPVLGPACLAPARCVASGAGTAGVCVVPDGSVCG